MHGRREVTLTPVYTKALPIDLQGPVVSVQSGVFLTQMFQHRGFDLEAVVSCSLGKAGRGIQAIIENLRNYLETLHN